MINNFKILSSFETQSLTLQYINRPGQPYHEQITKGKGFKGLAKHQILVNIWWYKYPCEVSLKTCFI